MSLDYDFSKVVLHDDQHTPVRTKTGDMTGLAQTMVFACMFAELGEITEKNYEKFHSRIALYELALGSIRKDKNGKDVFLTLDEVKAFVGLRTNVQNKTDKAFKSRLGTTVIDRLAQKMRV